MFGESGIRIASIIIGIIFILGLVVVANRFGGQIRQKLQTTKVASITITPSPTPVIESLAEITGQTKGETINSPQVNMIPDTGAETLILPVLITSLGIGLKLRKSS